MTKTIDLKLQSSEIHLIHSLVKPHKRRKLGVTVIHSTIKQGIIVALPLIFKKDSDPLLISLLQLPKSRSRRKK